LLNSHHFYILFQHHWVGICIFSIRKDLSHIEYTHARMHSHMQRTRNPTLSCLEKAVYALAAQLSLLRFRDMI
jgi:hypothetical protein